MKFSMLLPAQYDELKWSVAKQLGIEYAVTKASTELSGRPDPCHLESLMAVKKQFNDHGFKLYGLEGDQFDMSAIKLGLPERDQVIEKYIRMLRNMGELEIPLLCYNFMATIGWFRSRIDVPGRGGALVSQFSVSDLPVQTDWEEAVVSEKALWDNLHYFLDAVLPVAQQAGVTMALHPDDPPVSPLKGISRILTNTDAFEKIRGRYPIDNNAITFCQATFRLMTDDIRALAEKWLSENRIAFLHIRDIEGDKFNFRETFHDNGITDMVDMFRLYHQYGFSGLARPDHAPAMYGEEQKHFSSSTSVGYGVLGKIFAIGYLKGIYESVSHRSAAQDRVA